MKRKFKITYWLNGDIKVKEVYANSRYEAKMRFYLTEKFDDLVSIQEVVE